MKKDINIFRIFVENCISILLISVMLLLMYVINHMEVYSTRIVHAEPMEEDIFSESCNPIIYGGREEDFPELERLLLAKLVYDYVDDYRGKTVTEYVYGNPELYHKEIWIGSGILYDNLYSSMIGDWKIEKVFNNNTVTGFYGVAFQKDNDIILAFRGSEMFTEEFALDESNDWIATDIKFAIFNKLSGQFKDAEQAYYYIERNYNKKNDKNISFAGHSLGGALVTYASLVTGKKGYAFDGACGHVVDLVYYFHYLDIDTFTGVENQNFCNYTDDTGYVIADLIQHTNADVMYQVDRETFLTDLSENTLIPKLTDAGSHIAWSSITYEGNTIFLTDPVNTYEPTGGKTLDITKNILEAASESLDFKHPFQMLENVDYKLLVGALFGAVKDARVMLASKEGGVLRASDGAFFSLFYGYSAIMYGGEGDDELYGTWKDDVLIAGAGNNTLVGKQGIDTYIIDPNPDNMTTIIDEKGDKTIIILRNNIVNNAPVYEASTLICQDGTIVDLQLSQKNENVEIFSYDRGNLLFLGTLDQFSGEE